MNGRFEPRNMRAIRGPIMVITVGVLFAFNNFTPYNFGETWPVLIIVIGLWKLLEYLVARPSDPGAPFVGRT